MSSVIGFNIYECPSCKGQLSTPRYSSYNVNISGPLSSWVKCSHCNHTFELSKQTLLGCLPADAPMPISQGGFDLVGKTFEEKMLDLKRQTEAHHASNGIGHNRPPSAIVVTPPKAN